MKKPIAATVCSVVGTILLALVIVVCIPLTVPRIAGYQIYTVISGSMEPISYENFLGKVTLSVPMLSGILAAVVTVPGKIAAGSMILLALVLHVIAGKLKGSSKEQ